MSAHIGRAGPSYRAVVASQDEREVGSNRRGLSRRSTPRIHPALYVFSLSSAAILCVLAIGSLAGYAPPGHLPSQHDELLRFTPPLHGGNGDSHLDNTSAALGNQTTSGMQVSASWNNIANVLGGFSTTYVTSPQLNASWVARPAGFGPRIIDGEGLLGRLDYMKAASQTGGETDASIVIDRTGCLPVPPRYAPGNSTAARIALIQRGGCQFITKLLHAQAQGFDGVIVLNDYEHARRTRPDFERDGLEEEEHSDEDELISMWSPTREAAFLHIPSVFVSYLTGKTLETLLAVESDNKDAALVIMEPEDAPHFLLMDIIISLFFLPTIFTTVVLILTKVRQIRHRKQQRAPQTLVDSLPTFKWREDLELNLDALLADEKNAEANSAAPSGTGHAGMDSRLAHFLTKALRRPAPPGDGVTARHTVIPPRKARHIAKKIFQQKECAICLSDFANDEMVRLLPCGHLFHQTEIDSWLTEQKRWCPVCRYCIDEEDDEEASIGAREDASADADDTGRTTPVPRSAPTAIPRPMITQEDVAYTPQEYNQPVAGSSTASERTPLLPVLSRSQPSDKS